MLTELTDIELDMVAAAGGRKVGHHKDHHHGHGDFSIVAAVNLSDVDVDIDGNNNKVKVYISQVATAGGDDATTTLG